MTQQGAPQEPQRPAYERRPRHEKDEKEEEKRGEKDEKSRNEKDWDEKWRRDPINASCWAAMFIWAGLVLLGNTTGWGPDTFRWWREGNWWAIIMAGVGAILILCGLIRLLMPEHRRPIIGNLILGTIFLGVGLEKLSDWDWGVAGAIIFIVIGLLIILSGIFRRRK
jgi:hypothetical protein